MLEELTCIKLGVQFLFVNLANADNGHALMFFFSHIVRQIEKLIRAKQLCKLLG